MKATPRYYSSALISLAAILVHGSAGLLAQTALEIEQVRVVSTSGTVAALSANGQKVAINLANQPGAEIPIGAIHHAGSTLATGANSNAVVAIPATGTMVLGPETQVRLPKAGEAGSSLELLKGQLFMKISAEDLRKRGKGEFRLKTPAALLAVKGTRFFAQSKDGTDTAGVSIGTVEVSAPATQPVVLAAGNAVSVSPGQMGKPRALTAAETAADVNIEELVLREAGNSLGMRFVHVPGTQVLFGIHEVRYQDYAAYAAESPGVEPSWKDQSSDGYTVTTRNADHPVVNVSWLDVQKFCAWLSQKEGKTYRLPTDREWSLAVGIGDTETWEKDTTLEAIVKILNNQKSPPKDFPWGAWPPPRGAGNYSDQSRKNSAPKADAQHLSGFDDGFPTTAPVLSFKPNKLGLHDLGGNVWELTQDWWNAAKNGHVLRGGAWDVGERTFMPSSFRNAVLSDTRSAYAGFRCVIVK